MFRIPVGVALSAQAIRKVSLGPGGFYSEGDSVAEGSGGLTTVQAVLLSISASE